MPRTFSSVSLVVWLVLSTLLSVVVSFRPWYSFRACRRLCAVWSVAVCSRVLETHFTRLLEDARLTKLPLKRRHPLISSFSGVEEPDWWLRGLQAWRREPREVSDRRNGFGPSKVSSSTAVDAQEVFLGRRSSVVCQIRRPHSVLRASSFWHRVR